ncbi:DUF2156 domain-containing protein [Desulfoplanes sp. PS50]
MHKEHILILDFNPISLNEQADYGHFLKQTPQITSDYSFINLWGWQEEYDLSWAFTPDAVFIRQSRPVSCLWAPLGNWESMDWQAYGTALSEYPAMIRVPEQLKDILVNRWSGLHVDEARGQWDYLYSIPELIELAGRKYHKKKNLVNQFIRKHDYRYVALTAAEIEMALTLQTEWFLWKNAESDSTLDKENRAIVKVMRDWDQLENILGAGIVADDKMVAYTIAEHAPNDQMIIHFEKGCPNYKGIYQAMNQLFLKNTCCDMAVVNREQDLDDPGLRKAKESYHPIDFMKKYELRGFTL